MRSSAPKEIGWGLVVCGFPLLVYLRTLAPTVYALDSAELTTGAYTLGIVHAPGSPTYLLLGHLFSKLPVGDVGYRLNLMSACAAALTVLFAYRVMYWLTRRRFLAMAGAWLLAFSYYFWISALAAELYALHGCFVAALLWLAIQWRESAKPAYLYLLALLFGVGLGNHLSLVLMAPGLAWLIFTGSAQPSGWARLVFGAALCAIAGASVYLYLPLRYLSDPPLNYARDYWQENLATIDGFLWMISARMFADSIFSVPPGDLGRELLTYAARLWSNFVMLGALLGVVGLWSDFRRRTTLHIGLLLMFTAHVVFFLAYGATDKELMFVPTYVIWAVWIPLGVVLLEQRLGQGPNGWGIPGTTLLAFLALGALALNFERVDLSDDWSARTRGEDILTEMEPQAVYLGTWADIPILEYLQIVENRRPDVITVNLHFVGKKGARIAAKALTAGQPVYTSAPSLVGKDLFEFEHLDECRCYRVWSPQQSAGAAVAVGKEESQ